MSGEKSEVERLMELLAEEATWQGRLNGHRGQAEVAEREVKYWEDRLKQTKDNVEEFIRRKWKRNLEKARARAEYHRKQATEAKKRLREIRREIDKIIGGDKE